MSPVVSPTSMPGGAGGEDIARGGGKRPSEVAVRALAALAEHTTGLPARATLVVTSHAGTILAVTVSVLGLRVPDWRSLGPVRNAAFIVLQAVTARGLVAVGPRLEVATFTGTQRYRATGKYRHQGQSTPQGSRRGHDDALSPARGQFAYVEGHLADGETIPLMRLRYTGLPASRQPPSSPSGRHRAGTSAGTASRPAAARRARCRRQASRLRGCRTRRSASREIAQFFN